jgi:carbonic anhydrase/acetyltransferase-like protein (isoleucine patch superfamily)
MFAVRLAVLLSLFISSANALECGLKEESINLECNKTKVVKSMEELNTYLEDYALENNQAKNLLINFDINTTDSVFIHSPCMVKFKRDRSFESTGNLCVNAKEGVRFQRRFNLKANDVELYSKKRIVIRDHATIEVNDLSLLSNGDTLESRSHIRHTSNIKANNLTVFGVARATLGHTSIYNVANSITVDSEDIFSSIWKNTTITTKTLTMKSDSTNRISKGVVVNAETIDMTAPECKISNLETSALKIGNCFAEGRPVAKLSVNSKEVNIGEEIKFNASKSSDDIEIVKYEFLVNDQVTQSSTDPIFKTSFTTAGIFYVKVKVYDANNFVSSRSKKITVSDSLKQDSEVFFNYLVEDNELTLIFHQLLPLEEIKSAVFDFNNGEEVHSLDNFYHLDETKISNKQDGNYKVSLKVEDIYGNFYEYERNVTIANNEQIANSLPIVDFDVFQVNPKEVFVDLRKTFDPYGEMEDYIIDWGDESSSVLSPSRNHFAKHTYSSVGTYEVRLIAIKVNDSDNEVVKELIKSVEVTNIDPPSMNPIVDFSYEIEEFAPHVTFNINLSTSPTDEISSVVFDHGDGTFYTGTDKTHPHFYEPGLYHASLIVTDSRGVQAKQTLQIVITETGPPMISDLGCWRDGELTAGCEIIALDKQNQISNVNIDWGDGNVENIPLDGREWIYDDVSHDYAMSGVYDITFRVDTFRGESSSSSRTVEFIQNNNQIPVADIYCNSYELNRLECGAEHSIDYDGHIVSYKIITEQGEQFSNQPFFVIDFDSGGMKDIRLEVVDNQGAVGVRDISAYVEMNNAPYIIADCTANLLEVTCDASQSEDFDGQPLTFEWELNGKIVSNEPGLNYSSLSKGSLSIIVRVSDGVDLTEEYIEIDVTDDPSDLIYPRLACLVQTSSTVTCSAHESEGENLTYQWIVDGVLIDNPKNELSHEFNSLGDHVVSVIVSNEYFEKEVSEEFRLTYLMPKASFIYSLNEDGDVVLDASESSDAGRYVESYKWIINDEEYRSVREVATFRYDTVNGQVVTLEIKDENDNISTYDTLVDLSSENRPADIVLKFNQPKGRASRDVYFDLSDSSDPDGSIVKYGVIIEGQEFNGENYLHRFNRSGNHDVTGFVVDDKGVRIEKKISIYIDPLKFSESEDLFYPLDVHQFAMLNYSTDSEAEIFINGELQISKKISNESFSLILPNIPSQGSETELKIVIDGIEHVRKVTIEPMELPQDSKATASSVFEESLGFTNSILPSSPELTNLNTNTREIKDDLIGLIDQLETEDEKRLAAYLLKRMFKKFQKQNLNKRSFSQVTTEFSLPFIETVFAQGVAEVSEKEMLKSAQLCAIGLAGAKAFSAVISQTLQYITVINGLINVSAVLRLTPVGLEVTALSNAAMVAFAIFDRLVTHTTFASNFLFVDNCVSTVHFPVLEKGEISLNVDGAFNDGKYLVVGSGSTHKVDLKVKGYKYHTYQSKINEREHRLSKLIRETSDQYRQEIEDYKLALADMFTGLDSTMKWSPSGITLTFVTAAGDQIFKFAYQESLNKLLEKLGANGEGVGEADIVMDSGEYFKLRTNHPKVVGTYLDEKISYSSRVESETPFNHVVSTSNTGFSLLLALRDGESVTLNDTYKVIPGCLGNSFRIHLNGGGVVSSDSRVDTTVYVGPDAKVCSGARVVGNVRLTKSVSILGSGTRISSYRNNSDYKTLHANSNSIDIEGNVTIGSSTSSLGNPVISFGSIPDDKAFSLNIKNTGEGELIFEGKSTLEYNKQDEGGLIEPGLNFNVPAEKKSVISNTNLIDSFVGDFGNDDIVLVSSSNFSDSLVRGQVNISNVGNINGTTIRNEDSNSLITISNSTLENTSVDIFSVSEEEAKASSLTIANSIIQAVMSSSSDKVIQLQAGNNSGSLDISNSQVSASEEGQRFYIYESSISNSNLLNTESAKAVINYVKFEYADIYKSTAENLSIIGGPTSYINISHTNLLHGDSLDGSKLSATTDHSTISSNEGTVKIEGTNDVSHFEIRSNSGHITLNKLRNFEKFNAYQNAEPILLQEVTGEGVLEISRNNSPITMESVEVGESLLIDYSTGEKGVILKSLNSVEGPVGFSNCDNLTVDSVDLDSVVINVTNAAIKDGSISHGSINSIFSKLTPLSNMNLDNFSINTVHAEIGSNLKMSNSATLASTLEKPVIIGNRVTIIASRVSEGVTIGNDVIITGTATYDNIGESLNGKTSSVGGTNILIGEGTLITDSDISGEVIIKSGAVIGNSSLFESAVLNENVSIQDSTVYGKVVLEKDVIVENNSNIYGEAKVGSGAIIRESTIFGKAVVGDSASILDGSSVYDTARVESRATIIDSRVFGSAFVAYNIRIEGSQLSSASETESAYITSNKVNATCDGKNDEDESDPCMKNN